MIGRLFVLSVATVVLVSGLPQHGVALPIAPLNAAQVADSNQVIQVRATAKRATVSKRTTVSRRTTVNRNARVNKNVHVNRNVRVNRNVNVHRTVVVRRPYYRPWVARPYYGAIIGGVALGTVIGVSAAYAAPVAPAPNMCWFWADSAGMRGYWDYCVAP
jgi:hypothetical protein